MTNKQLLMFATSPWTFIFLLVFISLGAGRHHAHHENCDYCSNQSTFTREDLLNSNTKTVSHQIVDVFLVVARPQDYKYISNGNFWIGPKLMKELSKDNDTRVHIFTDTAAIENRGKADGFYMYDMGKEPFKAVHEHFFAMYEKNHHSINNVEYEYLCFFRWHLFRKLVEMWKTEANPIKRVLTIDTDVVMLINAAEFFSNAIQALQISSEDDGFDVVTISPGCVHLWTSTGLISYSNFIYEWYNKTQESVLHTTKQHAGYLYKRLHFSDMQMVQVYMKQNQKRRNHCFVEPSLHNIWRRNPNHACLLDFLKCIPMSRYDDMMFNNSVRWVVDKPQGRDEVHPYCLMHFQGDGAKELMAVYGRFFLYLHQNRTASLTGRKPIAWDYRSDELHDGREAPLLLQEKGRRDVYYFHHGHRRRVPNYDMFLALNFTAGDIAHALPELINAIPLGPDMTEPID